MPIFIDEFNQRILHSKHIGDITYDAHTQSDANDIEDVPEIGSWEDYTGSGGVNSKAQQQWAGTENELQGTIADIKFKENLDNLTDRGKSASTHRQRRIKRHKELGGNSC